MFLPASTNRMQQRGWRTTTETAFQRPVLWMRRAINGVLNLRHVVRLWLYKRRRIIHLLRYIAYEAGGSDREVCKEVMSSYRYSILVKRRKRPQGSICLISALEFGSCIYLFFGIFSSFSSHQQWEDVALVCLWDHVLLLSLTAPLQFAHTQLLSPLTGTSSISIRTYSLAMSMKNCDKSSVTTVRRPWVITPASGATVRP